MTPPLSPRPAQRAGWLALLALVAGIGGWSALARLSSAVIAPGQIAPAGNLLVIQHPEGGVIAQLEVSEGSRVRPGQRLARLDDTRLASQKAVADSRYWALVARRARLLAERDGAAAPDPGPQMMAVPELAAQMAGQARLFQARRDARLREAAQLEERQRQVRAQITGFDAQTEALRRERGLVAVDLANQRALRARGLAQAMQVNALARELARLDGRIAALVAARAGARGQLAELDIAGIRLDARARETALAELRPLEAEIAELAEERAALSRRLAALDLRAPAAGVVQGLALTTPRAVLRPAEPLLSIVRQDRPPVVTARIAPRDIDLVRSGQPVRLRLTAFDAQTTPELPARLTGVSADAFNDPATGQSYYRAEIAIAPDQAARLGGPLIPGMPVEVFIATGAHSPAAYLWKPFADYFARALRDG